METFLMIDEDTTLYQPDSTKYVQYAQYCRTCILYIQACILYCSKQAQRYVFKDNL